MKKTQVIEALRTIRKQKVSYISIVLIAFLAVTCFSGISFAAKGIGDSGSAFYDRQNFRDLEVMSSVMLSDKDLKTIADMEDVRDAEGVLRTNGKVIAGGNKAAVTVLSATERVNLPVLIEGACPVGEDEIALEQVLAEKLGAKVGDTVRLEDTSSVRLLKGTEFRVVGICIHPDHLTKPNRFGDYVLTSKKAFDQTLLAGRYVCAELVIEKEPNTDRFGVAYKRKVSEVSDSLEKLSVTSSREALESAWVQIATVKNEVLDQVLRPLVVIGLRMTKGYSEEEADRELENLGWNTEPLSPNLEDANLDAGVFRILDGVSLKLPEKENLVESVAEQLYLQREALKTFGIDLDAHPIPDDVIERLQEALNETDLSFFDRVLAATTMWNEGHARYLSTLRHLAGEDGDGQNFNGVWLTFDPSMNSGYTHMEMSISGISAIAIRFTLLFILVAAIVIYATVGKLVDEQKKLVGATKAFGFYNREVFAKYLLFGGSATLLGTVLGILAGTFLLQYFVDYAYGRNYMSGIAPRTVIGWQIAVIVCAGLVLAFAAVWFASLKLVRSTAVSLMQGNMPAGMKKGKRNKKSGLSLYQRLILRNMRTDAKRVFVTVVSIAGCCALILIGFSIYLSVRNTVDFQFDSIIRYEAVVSVEARANEKGVENVENALRASGVETLRAHMETGAFRVGSATEPAEFVVADLKTLPDFLHLRDSNTGAALTEDNGVLIPSSYATAYRLKPGDTCILIDGHGAAHTAKVGGVFEFYLGQTVVLGPEGYREIFGSESTVNVLLSRLNGQDPEKLTAGLKKIEGYETLNRSDFLKVMFNSYSDLLAIMMVLLIAAAGLMSAVILTNLVNICILQKKRELTIMRVNGFTTKEVKNYITREAFLTSAAGVLLGTGIGLLQFRSIMPALGRSYTAFITTPNLIAILIAAAVTVLFTLVIYRIALRKVKDLKLSDVA